MASSALEELKLTQKKLDSVGKKQEKSARYLEETTIRLVANYIIFQSIIFASVSNHSNLSCKYWWIPFCLSCLIAVVFTITFKTFVSNWVRTRSHHDRNFLQSDLIHYQIVVFAITNSKGSSSGQSNLDSNPETLECDKIKLYQRYAIITLVSVALVLYTIIILIACRSILCQS